MRPEQSWSLLDPKPCLLYVPKCDGYLVYWNGIALSHKIALAMAMEATAGIYPTPELKVSLEKDYQRLYYGNAFDTRAWDSIVNSGDVYPYLKKIMAAHLKSLLENKDAKEVIGWFDYSRARTLE